ncbi:MAG: phosphatase PAP2 family protein [Chitinophagales bacterium]
MDELLNCLKNFDYIGFQFINQTIANSVFDFLVPPLRNAYTWIPLYLILAAYVIHSRKKEAWYYVLYVLAAFALADSITHTILKPLFDRSRPCYNELLTVRLLVDHCGGRLSFPSTHASNHMAMALSIVLSGIFSNKWIQLCWILWAAIIGFAQVYVGLHYPADIIAGFVAGSVLAGINYKLILPALRAIHHRFIQKI